MKSVTGRAIPALLVILALSLTDQVFPSEKAADDNRRLFAFDEQHWVLFYDVPSRRFRAIRDNFVKRNVEDASRDLRVTENYLLESREPKLVYREKPIRQAWVLMQDTGEFLDRKILIYPEP